MLGDNGLYYFTFLWLAVFSVFPLTVMAQDFADDIQKMHAYYSTADTLDLDISMEVFRSGQDKDPYLTYKASVYKSGKNYYYRLEDTQLIMTEKALITIYNRQKQMVYRLVDKDSWQQTARGLYAGALDSLLQQTDSVIFAGRKNENSLYYIYTNSLISKTELHLDPESGRIRYLAYYYNTSLPSGVYMVKAFFDEKSEMTPSMSRALFDERSYIVFSEGKIRPAASYITYDLSIISNDN